MVFHRGKSDTLELRETLDGCKYLPAKSIAYIFVWMVKVRLDLAHKSMKKFRNSPLLLTKSSLDEVQTTGKKWFALRRMYKSLSIHYVTKRETANYIEDNRRAHS